jgi:putative methyltransferase (TIGR04325 family)
MMTSRFIGDYQSWAEASTASTGYNSEIILERVCRAALKVKHGEAAFERDSVAFAEPDYRWEMLACVLRAALKKSNSPFHLIDYGGSLASVYLQHKKIFFDTIHDLMWSVIEQPNFVRCGREEFETGHLRFYGYLNEAVRRAPVDFVLFSSVLQYLPAPYDIIEQVIALQVPTILFDRTPFSTGMRDQLTVQYVPEWIYPASYPQWFFSEERFVSFMESRNYEKILAFEGFDKAEPGIQYKGILYERL